MMRRLAPHTMAEAAAATRAPERGAARAVPHGKRADLFSDEQQANIHRTTPPGFVKSLLNFAGPSGVGLDPCSNTNSHVPAKTRWFGPHPSTFGAPVDAQLSHPLLIGPEAAVRINDPTGVYRAMLRAHPSPDDPVWKDGLQEGWGGYGLVYVNYPYLTADHRRWGLKMNFEASEGVEILCLTKAAPGTDWFQALTCARVGFWKGRLAFDGLDHGAKFDSAVLYYGPNVGAFESVFSAHGKVVIWTAS